VSRIFVHGSGAVSPAGWGVDQLCDAWRKNVPLPSQDLARPGWEKPVRVRNVPAPTQRPAFLAHPRLRRSTAIAQYTVGAALEAIGDDAAKIQAGELRLGVIVGVLSGAVNYTRRFFEEVMRDPATASPLIFPETVFNSSASHLGAFLGAKAANYTLVGDDGTVLQGLALAAEWLEDGRVDACVVLGAEENDWIISDALHLFHRRVIHTAGAGAIYLKPESSGVELAAVTDSFSLTQGQDRRAALAKVMAQLPSDGDPVPADRLREICGQAFTASAAWQCVIAGDLVRRKEAAAANVTVIGANQQAIGARFVKSG